MPRGLESLTVGPRSNLLALERRVYLCQRAIHIWVRNNLRGLDRDAKIQVLGASLAAQKAIWILRAANLWAPDLGGGVEIEASRLARDFRALQALYDSVYESMEDLTEEAVKLAPSCFEILGQAQGALHSGLVGILLRKELPPYK